MKPLIVIPARGNSKGVPGKNIKPLGGKPMLGYSLDAARHLFQDDEILVSTDDPEIKAYVESKGIEVPFLRPAELATDHADTYDVLIHALGFTEKNKYQPEVLILLQPTSPFRTSKHISEALDIYKKYSDLDMVVSVVETRANPYYVLFEDDEEGLLRKSKQGDFQRRQDCPSVWQYNGAIYIINVDSLKERRLNQFEKVKKYVMSEMDSLDIDTLLDWKLAEVLINERSGIHN